MRRPLVDSVQPPRGAADGWIPHRSLEEVVVSAIRKSLWLALGISMLTVPSAAADKPLNISLFPPIALAQPSEAVTAFRWNLIYGKNTSVKIVDLGFVNQTTTLSNGLQLGLVNYNESAFSGLQLGTVSYNKGTASGLQWSGFNYAGTAEGLQLAFVNYAENLNGFQIGVLNIAKSGGMFPVMVIANWKK
jgi:hypothetical protein